MSEFKFAWTPVANGIEVIGYSLLGGEKALPISEWPESVKQRSISVLAKLEALCEEGDERIQRLPNGYVIAHEIVAGLSEHQARLIGLPGNIPLELRLALSGPLVSERTKVQITWHNSSGLRVRGQEAKTIFLMGLMNIASQTPYIVCCVLQINLMGGMAIL